MHNSIPSMPLKTVFTALLKKYNVTEGIIEKMWDEIEKNYSEKKRYYHTLSHLEDLLVQLNSVKPLLKNYDTVLFTLFYHDAIYNAKRSDNEEQSAELAVVRMNEISIPKEIVASCKGQILATKSHTISPDTDTNYFTDADLSILGNSWEVYEEYYKKIRKEYSIYPDFMYNPGRKKVLAHFLAMKNIFKTEEFRTKFEQQARENLAREFELL